MLLRIATLLLLFVSCQTVSKSELKASREDFVELRRQDFEKIWGTPMKERLFDLPNRGDITSRPLPYSASFLPFSKGGLDSEAYQTPSTVAKYDAAFHAGEPIAQSWERNKHFVELDQNGSQWWFGHCNAWSIAANSFQEPMQAVTKNGVEFTRRDITNLLTEIMMGQGSRMLAGNRCYDRHLPDYFERRNPSKLGDCADTSPADFHLAVANWIGIQKYPIIIDFWTDDKVENFPAYAYEISKPEELSREEALLHLPNPHGDRIFDRESKRFFKVTMELMISYYTDAMNKNAIDRLQEAYPTHVPERLTYRYILETDEVGDLTGGEWLIDRAKSSIPDFVWVGAPLPDAPETGMKNPHIDASKVFELHEASIPKEKKLDLPLIDLGNLDH